MDIEHKKLRTPDVNKTLALFRYGNVNIILFLFGFLIVFTVYKQL